MKQNLACLLSLPVTPATAWPGLALVREGTARTLPAEVDPDWRLEAGGLALVSPGVLSLTSPALSSVLQSCSAREASRL